MYDGQPQNSDNNMMMNHRKSISNSSSVTHSVPVTTSSYLGSSVSTSASSRYDDLDHRATSYTHITTEEKKLSVDPIRTSMSGIPEDDSTTSLLKNIYASVSQSESIPLSNTSQNSNLNVLNSYKSSSFKLNNNNENKVTNRNSENGNNEISSTRNSINNNINNNHSQPYAINNNNINKTQSLSPGISTFRSSSIPVDKSNDETKSESNDSRPVTYGELTEALQMLKYDIHKELQVIIREQIRQFEIAKVILLKSFYKFYVVYCSMYHGKYYAHFDRLIMLCLLEILLKNLNSYFNQMQS